jgi:hypothetical protein
MEMGDDFNLKTSFKRDIAHVFDAVSSYLVKKKSKLKREQFEFILDTIRRQDLWDTLVLFKQVHLIIKIFILF